MAGEAVHHRSHLFHMGQDPVLAGGLRLEGTAIPVIEEADNDLSVCAGECRKYRIQLIQGGAADRAAGIIFQVDLDRKSTRLNSSH